MSTGEFYGKFRCHPANSMTTTHWQDRRRKRKRSDTTEKANPSVIDNIYRHQLQREQFLDTGSDSVMQFSISSDVDTTEYLSCTQTAPQSGADPGATQNVMTEIARLCDKSATQETSNTDMVEDLVKTLCKLVQINKLIANVQMSSEESLVLAGWFRDRKTGILNNSDHSKFHRAATQMENLVNNNFCSKTLLKDMNITRIMGELHRLKYFPQVLLQSLHYTIAQKKDTPDGYFELFRVVFITTGLELSKTFKRLMQLLPQNLIEAPTVIHYIDPILDFAAESYTGEILIGLETTIANWYNQTTGNIQFTTYLTKKYEQFFQHSTNTDTDTDTDTDSDSDNHQDLMFNKHDICKMFLAGLIGQCAASPTNIGWLTIFDNSLHTTTELHSTSAVSLSLSLSLLDPAGYPASADHPAHTAPELWKHWLKRKLHDWLHGSSETIHSLRYYRAPHPSPPAPRAQAGYCLFSEINTFVHYSVTGQRAMDRKYAQLLKKESRGRRKRDAIKILFT